MKLHKKDHIKDDERRCIRCRGRKQLYKSMNGWCFDNMGGVLQDCPMCLGKGVIKKIPAEELFKAEEKEEPKHAKKRRKEAKFEKEY